MGCQRRDEHDAAVLAHDRQQLLDEEERRADVDREKLVEILNRGRLDGRRLRDSGVGHQNVQPVSDHGADLLGELVWPVRRGKIGSDGIGTSAGHPHHLLLANGRYRGNDCHEARSGHSRRQHKGRLRLKPSLSIHVRILASCSYPPAHQN
jgi:hypothetical protein